jgi:lipid II:glycine glycyltransferase (peptidoglycan interpeptide bridge formation enzyme)
VAALLVLRHGAAATYHIAHTEAAGRKTSAQCLLIWSAMRWLQAKGVTRFELGQIDTERGASLARFKLGTGARVERLGGTWLWWPPVTRLGAPLERLDRRLMACG